MKNYRETNKPFYKLLLMAVVVMFTTSAAMAQQVKPSASGLAPVNGVQLYYEVYGKGRPIVLLHGAFMTIETNWGQLIPQLSKTRKVIAIELQGHGHSPFAERKLSAAAMASDVAAVMDLLKVDSADIMGYSMGGSVAYAFAAQYPKRVTKLVIISSTYKSGGWLPEVNNAFKDFKPDFFDATPMKTAYDAIAPDKTKWSKFIEQMLVFIKEPFNIGDSGIAKITAPVLIISGDNDGLDKVELAKTYQLLGGGVAADMQPMPKSQLAIIPSQSHVSIMMQTATILNYAESFLK